MTKVRAEIKLLQDIELIDFDGIHTVHKAGTYHSVIIAKGEHTNGLIFPSGFELYGIKEGEVYQLMDDEIMVLTE